MSDQRPIGVFDSGVGGLTVVLELRRRLPDERLVYIADLAHFPYGPRYQNEVREFALRIIADLVAQDVKLVVIACNTASAGALQAARERFDVPILGVIAPGAQAAVEQTRNGRVAVISTEGTFASQQYLHAMWEANPGVGILPIAAPELVQIVEEGDADTPRADAALTPIIEQVVAWGADTLVLGCTHYPLLRNALRRVADDALVVVDSAETTAARVERVLGVNRLLSDDRAQAGDRRDGSAQLSRPTAHGALRLQVTARTGAFDAEAARLFSPGLPASELRAVDVGGGAQAVAR